MREKLMWFVILVLTFLVGSGVTYCLQDNNKRNVIISQATETTGVIQCGNDITIDETGISLSIGKIYDATVTIQNYNNNQIQSMGSGFVYKKDDKFGYILTNQHVIDSATKIKVTMANDDIIDGEVLGSDKYLDLAVVRIDVKYVSQVATIGTSENSNLGDSVFTVGSPVSYEYRGTVTKGTLSGKNRMVSVSVNSSEDWVMKVIQVDAAINPGNSGGPLCNVNGEVIGINSMKLVEDEVEGMGFAIPIEYALNYVDSLEAGSTIDRPLVGITMLNITDTYGLFKNGIMIDDSITEGVAVLSVSGNSGASKAGLVKGDIITKIAGVKVKSAAYFKYELYRFSPGDTIEITYIRNGEEKTAAVTLTKAE